MLDRTLSALVAACLSIALASASAQTLKLQKEAPTPLSRDELRACMEHEESLQQRKRAQEIERAEIARENNESALAARQLAEDVRRTDTRDFSKVDGYNARAAAQEARVASLNTRVERFNADVDQLNQEGAAHIERCTTRPYDAADRDAILKEPRRLSPRARPSAPAASGPAR